MRGILKRLFSKRKPVSTAVVVEELEPRILLSGDFSALHDLANEAPQGVEIVVDDSLERLGEDVRVPGKVASSYAAADAKPSAPGPRWYGQDSRGEPNTHEPIQSPIQIPVQGPFASPDASEPSNAKNAAEPIKQSLATFVVSNTNDSGPGSLRQAIFDANTVSGADTITFNIGGGGPHTIVLNAALPQLVQTTTIDATTQGGYNGTPLIALDGSGANGAIGLRLFGGENSVVRGLAIHSFDSIGIAVYVDSATIEDNYIGTNLSGNIALPNVGAGVEIQGANNTVQNNVIAGNANHGIVVAGVGSTANVIRSNMIGVNAAGTAALHNGQVGVNLANNSSNTMVGGTGSADRNIISSAGDAISISTSSNNSIAYNFIGTDVGATTALGTGLDGIQILGISNNTRIENNVIASPALSAIAVEMSGNRTSIVSNVIGTDISGLANWGAGDFGILVDGSPTNTLIEQNFVAFSGQNAAGATDGIAVIGSTDVSVLGNTVYSSVGEAIDLWDGNNDGVTANDAGDVDTGPNDLQNFPALVEATLNGGNITLSSTLNSNPSTQYRVDYFATGPADGSGYGEARQWLGSTLVTTDASGQGSDSGTTLAAGSLAAGDQVSATATPVDNFSEIGINNDLAFGGTSELAQNIVVQNGPIVVDTSNDNNDAGLVDGNAAHDIDFLLANKGADGLVSLREAIIATNNSPNGASADEIHFDFSASDAAHFYYQDDGIAGQVSLSNRALTSIADDSFISDIDPDYTHSWWSIALASDLPVITDELVLDGYSQSGASELTIATPNAGDAVLRVEIDSALATGNAFTLGNGSDSSRLQGLVINQSANAGISVQSSSQNHHIRGNYIGTDISGTLNLGNRLGLSFSTGTMGVLVGGLNVGDRNLISGNNTVGISFFTNTTTNHSVFGNFIGTDVNGTQAVGNGSGVQVAGTGITVGGATAAHRNVISGNTSFGLTLSNSTTNNNVIQGNYIGTDAFGTAALGNQSGIRISGGTSNNTIGGVNAGEGNVIAFNSFRGIGAIGSGVDNSILGNSIYDNGSFALGIDLGSDGKTPNDPEDTDTGVNDLLNFPVLKKVEQNGSDLDLEFSLDVPAGNYRVEFFDNPNGLHLNDIGEGESFIGFATVSVSGATGYEDFTASLVGVTASALTNVTTTVTEDLGAGNFGNTSEFGPQFDGAGVLIVDTSSDINDAGLVNGNLDHDLSFLLGNRGADGLISLREAIIASNNTPNDGGPDSIRFDIPGAGTQTISVGSFFDRISDAVTIDGLTQPGAAVGDLINGSAHTLPIEIDMSAVTANGSLFVIDANNTALRGLVVNGLSSFTTNAIELAADNVLIEYNYIGTSADGLSADAISGTGIELNSSSNNVVQHNVISAAAINGIQLNTLSNSNTIRGNLFGTDATGLNAIPSNGYAVRISGGSSDNLLGGNTEADRNVIAGSAVSTAVYLYDATTTNNRVQGNYIGTDRTGLVGVNQGNGVQLAFGSSNNTIGGVNSGEGNLIAFSNSRGVILSNSAGNGNAILGNTIFGNANIGIDLNANEVSNNDPNDVDTGPNNLQNFPVLIAARTDEVNTVELVGSLQSEATKTYRIEFFANTTADATGHGEGERYLGFTNVTTDASGNASFNASVAAAVSSGESVSATATEFVAGELGSTSEFSLNVIADVANSAPTFTLGDGHAEFDYTNSDDVAAAVAIQADGKIVIAGETDGAAGYDFALLRLNPDGTPDTSFGTAGKVITPIGSNSDFGHDLIIQPDGKIVVAGNAFIGGVWQIAVARYNADGSLDTTFSGDGIQTTAVGADNSYGQSVALQADGRIVVAGRTGVSSATDALVIRYTADGNLDNSFSGDGIQTISFTANSDRASSVAVQADGAIVIAGTANGDFALARLNSDGSLDTSLNGSGMQTTSISAGYDSAEDLALQADGRIILAGRANGNEALAVARYLPDGSLDSSFNSVGTRALDLSSGNDIAHSVLVQADGKIIVSGSTFDFSQNVYSVVRFNPNGGLDTSFSGDGTFSMATGVTSSNANGAALLADGGLVLVGNTYSGTSDEFGVIRLDASGNIDQRFDPIQTLDESPTLNQGSGPVRLDADVHAFDAELSASDNFSGATVTLARNGGPSGDDLFGFDDANGITLLGSNLIKNSQVIASFDTSSVPGELRIVFTDANGEIPTNADVDSILSQINYDHAQTEAPASVQVNWQIDDGNGGTQGSGGALQGNGSVVVNIIPNTLVVDTASDNNDAGLVDGNASHTLSYLLANKGADGFVSLREAIIATNNTANGASPDQIFFDIPVSDPNFTNEAGGIFDGDEHWTISTQSALPVISDTVVIDGTSQNGFDGTPVIEIDGSGTSGATDGFELGAGSDGSTLQGLVINNFARHGIYVNGGDNHVIRGNYIGTDVTGSLDFGNAGAGIVVRTASNLIGGSVLTDTNVISGNDGDGVLFELSAANANNVQGNYIGLDASGAAALENGTSAVRWETGAGANTIGGALSGQGNVIVGGTFAVNVWGGGDGSLIQGNLIGLNAAGDTRIGNTSIGVHVSGVSGVLVGGSVPSAVNVISTSSTAVWVSTSSANTTVEGNLLGTDVTGTVPLSLGGVTVSVANGSTGTLLRDNVIARELSLSASDVNIQGNWIGTDRSGSVDLSTASVLVRVANGASNIAIGGVNDGEGNTIAFGNGVGVGIESTAGNAISVLGNSIYANATAGIDILVDGVSSNDAEDTDAGPNDLLNFPVLAAVNQNGSDLDIDFDLDLPAGRYRIEFFDNPNGVSGSGHGEGEQYLGFADVTTTGAAGFESFSTTLIGVTASAIGNVASTATLTANTVSGSNTIGNYFSTSEFSAAVNTAPTATNLSAAEVYTEDVALNLIDIIVSDSNDTLTTVTLTLSDINAGSLSTGTSGAVSSTFDQGTGTWVASGAIDDVNTLLAGLVFTPAANYNGIFSIATELSDGSNPAVTGIKNVSSVAVNDAPEFSSLPNGLFTETTVSSQTLSLASGDFDGDGDIDIVSGDFAGDLILFANNGSGGLNQAGLLLDTTSEIAAITAADIDNDSDLDLIVAAYDGTSVDSIFVLENDGAANFTSVALENIAQGANDVAVGDLDGDGDLDIAAAFWFSNEVIWYEQVSAGSWSGTQVDTVAGAISVEIADVNGDGDADLIATARNTGEILWFQNDGAANPSFTRTVAANVPTPYSSAIADFNGDGRLDIGFSSLTGDQIGWLENSGTATPTFTVHTFAGSFDRPLHINATDIDGDGDTDIVGSVQGDSHLAVFENDGAGNFDALTLDANASNVRYSLNADLDGDGDQDFVAATDSGIRVYDNAGSEGVVRVRTNEFTTIAVPGISVADVDAGSSLIEVNISALDGSLSFSSTSGLVFSEGDGNLDSSATFTGTIADINSAFTGLQFTPTQYFNGETAFELRVSDLGNTGSGGALIALQRIHVDVLPVNDGPMFTALNGGATFVETGPAVQIDTNASVSDPELDALNGGNGNYSEADMAIRRSGGANSDDLLAFSSGNGISQNAGNLVKNGNVIASFDTSSVVGQLRIVFTDANGEIPTSADVESIIRQITYANSNSAPPNTVSLDWLFRDQNSGSQGAGGNLGTIGTTLINISALNNAPQITNLSAPTAFNENGASILLDNDVEIFDAELAAADNYNGASLQISRSTADPADVFSNSGALAALNEGGPLVLSGTTIGSVIQNSAGTLLIGFNANATQVLVNQAIQLITYRNSSDDPESSADLQWFFEDGNSGAQGSGGAAAALRFQSVSINEVNDTPAITVPGSALQTTEQTNLALQGAGFSLSDADAQSGGMFLNLVVDEGSIQFDLGDSGVSLFSDFGTSVVFSGTLNQLNAFITGASTGTITYVNTLDDPAPLVNFQVLLRDNGNTGADPGLSGNGSYEEHLISHAINITSVNDAPTATNLNSAETFTEDTPLNLIDIVVSDDDHTDTTVSLALSDIAAGSLSTATSGAVTSTFDASTGIWTASGAIADVNTLLAGLIFTPSEHYDSDFSIASSVRDGVAAAVIGNKAMTAIPVNDAPLSDDGAFTGTEDVSSITLTLSGSDLDGAIQSFVLQSLPSNGSLYLDSGLSTPVTTSTNYAATAESLQLYFVPDPDWNGIDNVSFVAVDNQGLSSSPPATISITVTALNDTPTAINSGAPESYTEDQPLNLIDMVVSDVDDTLGQVALMLSNPSAGSLNTATAGSVTSNYDAATGVWTASGSFADINTLLAGLTFTPAPNFDQDFEIQTNWRDNHGGAWAWQADIKEFTATPVDDAPTATNTDTPQSYIEDTDLAITPIAITDVDSANVSVVLTLSDPSVGVLSTNNSSPITPSFDPGTGQWIASGPVTELNSLLSGLVFSPQSDRFDDFTLSVSIDDGVNPPLTGSKSITGIAVNDPPVATNLNAPETYLEDSSVNLADIVLSDVDNNVLSVSLTLSDSSAGTLSTATIGSSSSSYNTITGEWTATGLISELNGLLANLVFSPADGYDQDFSIVTLVSDGIAEVRGTKIMSAMAVNDAPVLSNTEAADTFTEDLPLELNELVVSDIDSPNATVTLSLSDPDAGSLLTSMTGSVQSTYDAATGIWSASGNISDVNALLANLVFSPSENYDQPFTIAVAVSDGVAAPVLGSRIVNAIPQNDLPVSTNDSSAVAEGGQVLIDLLANDYDVEGFDPGSINIVSGPARGVVTVNPNGTVTYQHDDSESTSDVFSYTVLDSDGASTEETTVSVEVDLVNDNAPIAEGEAFSLLRGQTLFTAQSLLNNDIDSDTNSAALNIVLITPPQHGTLVVLADGNIQYTPDQDFIGTDSFAYSVSDGELLSDPVAVSFNVLPSSLVDQPEPDQPITEPENPEQSDPDANDGRPDSIVVLDQPLSFSDEFAPILFDNSLPELSLQVFELDDNQFELVLTFKDELVSRGEDDPRALNHYAVAVDEESFTLLFDLGGLIEQLQGARREFDLDAEQNTAVVQLLASSGIALSAGLATWVLRGGALLASMLSTLPAWRTMDPLPIVARRDEVAVDDDETQKIFQ